jgi:hypothetical protein
MASTENKTQRATEHGTNGLVGLYMEKPSENLPEWDLWDESLNGLAPGADALARAMADDDPSSVLADDRWSYDEAGILTLTLRGQAAEGFCNALPDRVRSAKARRS